VVSGFVLQEAKRNFSSLLHKSNPWTSFDDFLVLIYGNDFPGPVGTVKASSDAPRDDIDDRLAVGGQRRRRMRGNRVPDLLESLLVSVRAGRPRCGAWRTLGRRLRHRFRNACRAS
jgi:hypothetical protein